MTPSGTSASKPDTAGVIAPPPLIVLGALVLGLVLNWLVPVATLSVIPSWLRVLLAVILIGLGLALALQARVRFGAAGTPVQPWRPTAALVTSGVFAHLRNPMYFGMTLIFGGLAIGLANDWLLLTGGACALLLHYGVVLREERYLEQKFGQDYVSYKARVPRYGWKA